MRSRVAAVIGLCLVLVLCCLWSPRVKGVSSDIVISQIYGGGGNSGATLKNDFIELFNRGTTTVSVTGWSVQYASTTGTSWQRTNVSGSIPPGGYLLVQEAQGAGGSVSLPAPDATGTIPMSATAGKVALVNNQTTITSGTSCPSGSSIVDFVGYGSGTNCFEGTGPTATLSNPTAALRLSNGCVDTDVNSADFSTGAPNPRNSASPLFVCGSPGGDLVVSQLYGGGGNSGATLSNDYIEILNRGTTSVSVNGWSVQYASSTGSSWQVTALTGVVAPGKYYLVQESSGGPGIALPTPDATGSTNLAASAGKVLLVTNSTPLSGTCPTGSQIIDFVGYGSGTNCFEGSGPTGAPSNTTADLRKNFGCTDTNDNAADFTVGTPNPRNSASPMKDCNAPPPPTPIHDIQGSGSTSPLVNTSVTTTGIVTGLKSNGFFLQARDTDVDADANTSEGIFVFTSSVLPAAAVIGNEVKVSGTVVEFIPGSDPNSPPLTELSGVSVTLMTSGNSLPLPKTLAAADTSPGGSIEQLEKYEGMRVYVSSLTVVGPTLGSVNETNATATSNGVFYGVITGVVRPFREPGVEVPDPLPAGSPCCVPRFDANPERLRVDSDAQPGSTAIDVTAGATVMNITGVLDYGFRTYTILPDAATPPSVTGNITATDVPVPIAGEFTIASFNMERFFDTINDPGTSDAVLTPTAFDNRLNKASLIIRNILHIPDILGVVEMENLSTLQALANRISQDAIAAGQPDPAYAAYLVEGNDIGGIDVGFLVKPSRVTVNSVTQVGAAATYTNPQNNQQELLNDRPPLVLDAIVHQFGYKPTALIVIANHLRSLNGVDDPSDGTRVRAKRRAQAEFLANYIQGRQVADPNERIVALGDFNAFQFNDGYVDSMGTIKGTPTPADQVVLASSDLVNPDLIGLSDSLPQDERYSFVFDGNAQVLDHILINQNVVSLFNRMKYARVNGDFPEIYRNDATRPERLSDHDPEVAYFLLPPNNPPTANAGADQLIACASLTANSVTLSGSGSSDPDGDTLTYTWTGPFPEGGGTVTGVNPAITLPIGVHTIHLTVDDGNGGTATDDVVITIPVVVQGLQSPLAALTLDGNPLVYPDKAFKLNRTLPLRLQLSCGSMVLGSSNVAAPQIVGITRGSDALDLSTMDLDAGESNDNGVAFRFSDPSWVFNLSTKGWTAGTYFVNIQMPDGLRYNSAFVLR